MDVSDAGRNNAQFGFADEGQDVDIRYTHHQPPGTPDTEVEEDWQGITDFHTPYYETGAPVECNGVLPGMTHDQANGPWLAVQRHMIPLLIQPPQGKPIPNARHRSSRHGCR
jgi:hypothetical protein